MILGLCCAKNSEAWIEAVLRSHLTICDRVLFLDDGSTDKTGEIAQSFDRVDYWRQDGLPRNEARDRNGLFEKAHAFRPEWCWWFDGDETLWRGSREDILNAPADKNTLSTTLLGLWGDEDHVAADWSHPKLHLFRYLPDLCAGYRWRGRGPHGLHCGGRPRLDAYQNPDRIATVPIVELHWSWMTAAACAEKLRRYREWDPAFGSFRPYRRFERAPKDIHNLNNYIEGERHATEA